MAGNASQAEGVLVVDFPLEQPISPGALFRGDPSVAFVPSGFGDRFRPFRRRKLPIAELIPAAGDPEKLGSCVVQGPTSAVFQDESQKDIAQIAVAGSAAGRFFGFFGQDAAGQSFPPDFGGGLNQLPKIRPIGGKSRGMAQ
jgi:hypothetical protein